MNKESETFNSHITKSEAEYNTLDLDVLNSIVEMNKSRVIK